MIKETLNSFGLDLNKKLISEGFTVSFTEYLSLGSFVLVNFLINKYYSTEYVGVYFLSYSIAQIGILGVAGSFSPVMRRDLSVKKYNVYSYIENIQSLRIFLLLLTSVLTVLGILLFFKNLRMDLVFIILMLGTKGFDALTETYYTAYQSLDRTKDYAKLKIANTLIFIVVSVVLCISHFNIIWLYFSQLFVAAGVFLICKFHWSSDIFFNSKEMIFPGPSRKLIFLEALPIVINTLVFQLGLRLNTILIFGVLGAEKLGIFSIILMVIGVFTGVASTLGVVGFGVLTKAFADNFLNFELKVRKIVLLFLILGLLSFLLCAVLSPFVIFLFGLSGSEGIYFLMASSIPFIFVTSAIGGGFVIIKRQKTGMYLSFIVLIFNFFAYYLFSYYLGLVGSAFAFLLTSVFQSALIYFCILNLLEK